MSDHSHSSLIADDTDEYQPGPAAKRKAPAESSPPSKHTRGPHGSCPRLPVAAEAAAARPAPGTMSRRQISGLQKKLANAAHNLQKKEDELSDQLVAYGCLEGKYEAMKAKYEALRAAG
ncbi:unnamed protein product [Tilletia laevis]|nr:unnamed protein product [Tilletia laevis]